MTMKIGTAPRETTAYSCPECMANLPGPKHPRYHPGDRFTCLCAVWELDDLLVDGNKVYNWECVLVRKGENDDEDDYYQSKEDSR